MIRNRFLLIAVVLVGSLVLVFSGCNKNPLPAWDDPWPTGKDAPAISSVSPETTFVPDPAKPDSTVTMGYGAAGDAITISGSNMNATPEYNFVLLGAGNAWRKLDVSSASETQLTATLPDGVNDLGFDTKDVIDTVMGWSFWPNYPDSEVAAIDTIKAADGVTDSLYDTTWTVYEGPETVLKTINLPTEFNIKMAARGSELWSNSVPFLVKPPETSLRWPPEDTSAPYFQQ